MDEQVRASGMRNSVSRAWATNRSEYFTSVALFDHGYQRNSSHPRNQDQHGIFRKIVCSGVTSKNSVCASETVTWHDLNENDVEKNIYSKDRKEILARFRLDKMDNFRK